LYRKKPCTHKINKMEDSDNHIIEPVGLKAKTRQEMAAEYKISVNTFKKVLKLANITLPKGLIFPNTQQIIYKKIGLPDLKKDKNENTDEN